MFKIDCTVVPSEVTDFVFDHLHDDVENDEVLELDYENQLVLIDTGNMAFANTVTDAVKSRAREKIMDMRIDTPDDSVRFSSRRLDEYMSSIENDIELENQ